MIYKNRRKMMSLKITRKKKGKIMMKMKENKTTKRRVAWRTW